MTDPIDKHDVNGWRHAAFDTPPKTGANMEAVPILAWVPEHDAPENGDVRVTWWEPGAERWWSDTDLPVEFTWWQPCPPKPEKAA